MSLKQRYTICAICLLALLCIAFLVLPHIATDKFGYLEQRVRIQNGAAEVTEWEGCYSTWTYFDYEEFAAVAADMWDELAERYPNAEERTLDGATVSRLVRQVELPNGSLGDIYLTEQELWAIPYLTEAARAYGFRTAWLKSADGSVHSVGNTDLVTVAVDGVYYHEYRFTIPMAESLLRMMERDETEEMVIHPDIVLLDGRRVTVPAYRTVMAQELAYAKENDYATIALRHHWQPEYTPQWGETGFWFYQVQRLLQGIINRTGWRLKHICLGFSCLMLVIFWLLARSIKKIWRWQKRKRIVRRCRKMTANES